MKKKIVHFIYDLGRGGAEIMLVRAIKELPEYEHVVVTIIPLNLFGAELKCDKAVCFNMASLYQLPLVLFRFGRLVRKERPALVHTHLFWPTIIARISTPRRIPLVTTIHAFIATSVEYKRWYIRLLDKITYRLRKSVIIVVAKGALTEYFSFLKLKPWKAYPLYTFVDAARFTAVRTAPQQAGPVFRIISVGALREQKNYSYLIRAFEQLRHIPVQLDIYGAGPLRTSLEAQIHTANVPINLMGEVRNIEQVLPQYDLYVMASSFEGFSLSVLEAMAMGMPMLLSDIPSFREQAEGNARYFSLHDPGDFVQQLQAIINAGAEERHRLGALGQKHVLNNFTLPKHIEGLRHIYDETLNRASL